MFVNLNKGCKGSRVAHLDFKNALKTLPRQELLNRFAATNLSYWLVKWVHSCFTGLSQCIRSHNKASVTIPNNCGVLQGAVLSSFIYTLLTSDHFSESLVSFLKYADDVVIGHRFRDAQVHFIINNALIYASTWSEKNDLNLNPNKGVQCIF